MQSHPAKLPLPFSPSPLFPKPIIFTSFYLLTLPSFISCFQKHSVTMMLKLFLVILLFQKANSLPRDDSKGSNGLVVIEEAHQNWVKLMGSFNHSLLQKASNKFRACRTIKVHKNPKKGDFVSVQGAINSVPLVNLCRVVISVSAGIYRYEFPNLHIIIHTIVTNDSGGKLYCGLGSVRITSLAFNHVTPKSMRMWTKVHL